MPTEFSPHPNQGGSTNLQNRSEHTEPPRTARNPVDPSRNNVFGDHSKAPPIKKKLVDHTEYQFLIKPKQDLEDHIALNTQTSLQKLLESETPSIDLSKLDWTYYNVESASKFMHHPRYTFFTASYDSIGLILVSACYSGKVGLKKIYSEEFYYDGLTWEQMREYTAVYLVFDNIENKLMLSQINDACDGRLDDDNPLREQKILCGTHERGSASGDTMEEGSKKLLDSVFGRVIQRLCEKFGKTSALKDMGPVWVSVNLEDDRGPEQYIMFKLGKASEGT